MEAVYAFVNFVVTVGEVVAGAAGISIPITTAGTVTAAIIGTTAIVGGTIGLSKLYEIDMNVPDTDYARQKTVRGGTQPVKTVYGEALVSGPIAFLGAGGTGNSSLYQVIALTGHESEAITDIYFDNVKIQNSDINSGSASGGAVAGSTIYGQVNSQTIAYVNKHLGDDQTADTMINNQFNRWTDDHVGEGVTYIATQFYFPDDDDIAEVWNKHTPNDIKALVKGVNNIYDPRDDTGGNGDNPASASFQSWSDNPALCVANYLTNDEWGMGVSASKVDWDAVADAADFCDDLQAIPGSTTQKRFTCNGVLFGTENHQNNVSKLLSAMNGSLVYTGGKYVITAGQYIDPAHTLTEDDLNGHVTLTTTTKRADRFNTITGIFNDPDHSHKQVEFPKVQISSAVQRDNNEVLSKQIQLSMTNNVYMAQRLAYQMINRSNDQMVLDFPANLKGLRVAIGDRVNVTINQFAGSEADPISFVNKVFVCTNFSFTDTNAGGVNLTLIEDNESSYYDATQTPELIMPVSAYSTVNLADGTITDGFRGVPAPSNLSAVGVAQGIALTWTNPVDPLDFTNIKIYRVPGTVSTFVLGDVDQIYYTKNNFYNLFDIAKDTTYTFWIEAIKGDSSSSKVGPDSATAGTLTADSIPWTSVEDRNIGVGINGDNITLSGVDTDSSNVTGQDIAQSGINQDITITSGGVTVNGGGARIMGGQTAYDTGTGFFLGHVSGDNRYKFSVGNSSGQKLTFDDGVLTVTGAVTVQSGSIANDVTIGGTAASTVESGANAGATALQDEDTGVNLGLDDGSIGGITITSTSIESSNFSSGSAGFKLESDGTFETGDGTFRGAITATSGSIANSVTIGGTAASVVESGAAAGATASQVNKGLALLLNSTTSGSANNGEAALVGIDKTGTPETGTDGFIQWKGSKVTIERNQMLNAYTILTTVANKRGFIVFDVNKTDPFNVGSTDCDVAFAWKEGDQWYYDNNTTAVSFSISTMQDDGAELLAIGYLETSSTDLILTGGLIEPVQLETAPMPGDTFQSGSVGGVTITPTKLYHHSGQTTPSFGNENTAFYLDSSGNFSLKDKLQFDGSTLTVDGAVEAQSFAVLSSDPNDQTNVIASDVKGGSVSADAFDNSVWSAIDLRILNASGAQADTNVPAVDEEASLTGIGSPSAESGPFFVTISGAQTHSGRDIQIAGSINFAWSTSSNFTNPSFSLQVQRADNSAFTTNLTDVGSAVTVTATKYLAYTVYVYTAEGAVSFSTNPSNADYYWRLKITASSGVSVGPGSLITDNTAAFSIYESGGTTGNSTNTGSVGGLSIGGDTTISGNLTVTGSTTTLTTQDLQVNDQTIVLNFLDGDSSSTANGSGIVIQDAVSSSSDASILWDTSDDEFDFSHGANFANTIKTKKIEATTTSGSNVIEASSTGSGVQAGIVIESEQDNAQLEIKADKNNVATGYDQDPRIAFWSADTVKIYQYWDESASNLTFSSDVTGTSPAGIHMGQSGAFTADGNGTFNGGTLTVSSGTSGDSFLIIEADTDNDAEGDHPAIYLKQDGGIIESAIRLEDNQLEIINNVSTGGAIRFRTGETNNYSGDPSTGATTALTIDSSQTSTFAGSGQFTSNTGDPSVWIKSTRPTLGFTDTNSFTDSADYYIIRGGSDNLLFQWYDDSAGTIGTNLTLENNGSATLGGNLTVGGSTTILGTTVGANHKVEIGERETGRGFLFEVKNANGTAAADKATRMFMAETGYNSGNSSYPDSYGLSLVYEGMGTTTFDSGFVSTLSNGQWGLYGHYADSNGTLILQSDREGSFFKIKTRNRTAGDTDTIDALTINSEQAATFASLITATHASFTTTNSTAPSAEDLNVSGYGIIGNRTSPVYVHNNGTGGVRISGNATLGNAVGVLINDTSATFAGSASFAGNITTTGTSITVDPASGDAVLFLQGAAGQQTLRLDQNSIRTTTNTSFALMANSSTVAQRILANGRVKVGTGVGTTDRSRHFTVEGSGDLMALYSSNDGAGGAQLDFIQNSSSKASNDAVGIINFSSDARQYSSIRGLAGNHTTGVGEIRFGLRLDTSTYDHDRFIFDTTGADFDGTLTTTGNISINASDGFVYLNNIGTGNSGIYVRGITSSGTLRSHSTDNHRWEISGSQKMELDSTGQLNVVGNIKADYSLLGRGPRSANRGELHLNATSASDVSEIFFGFGDGYTDGNIRWGISDRGSGSDKLIFYKGPYHGGFASVMELDASSSNVKINSTSNSALLVYGNGAGLHLQGGNNRIWFSDYRALEGSTDGSVLQIGETYTNMRLQTTNIWAGDTGDVAMTVGYNGNTGTVTSGKAKMEFCFGNSIKQSPQIRFSDNGDDLGWTIGANDYNDNAFIIDSNNNGSPPDIEVQQSYTGFDFAFLPASKDFYASGNITAYSDRRIKDNIETIDNALERVMGMRGVFYTRKDLPEKGRQTGVIAQEMQEQLPEVVIEDSSGRLSVSYGNVVGTLIEAIKTQQEQIEDLKQTIEEMKHGDHKDK